jgi:tetratricopeptide (TPR) repeat protein
MRVLATALAVALAAFVAAGAGAAEQPQKRDDRSAEAPAPKTPAEMRADLYARLAVSRDDDETEGLVGVLLAAYSRSGSDTGDLLLERAHKAIDAKDSDSAEQILDAAIAFMPDQAEAWNARATLRYLDDDYDGSMADIAETLKREPRHLGALIGMASILEARDKTKEALEVYERVLTIAPHWKTAEEAAAKLRAEVAGQEL